MKPSTILISAGLVTAVISLGAVYFLRGGKTQETVAEASSPATAGDASRTRVPTAEQGQRNTPERIRQLALEIERALVARDPQQRETAFNVLLPELLQVEPARVVGIVARQEPGEARDALRDEVTRQWIRQDREAAIEWIGSLNEAERQASATIAMRTLAASEPALAISVADQFGVGRDDGSLEHIVQIWATENLEEAMRWIDRQPPDDPRTAQLRARIEQVRGQKQATSQ